MLWEKSSWGSLRSLGTLRRGSAAVETSQAERLSGFSETQLAGSSSSSAFAFVVTRTLLAGRPKARRGPWRAQSSLWESVLAMGRLLGRKLVPLALLRPGSAQATVRASSASWEEAGRAQEFPLLAEARLAWPRAESTRSSWKPVLPSLPSTAGAQVTSPEKAARPSKEWLSRWPPSLLRPWLVLMDQ